LRNSTRKSAWLKPHWEQQRRRKQKCRRRQKKSGGLKTEAKRKAEEAEVERLAEEARKAEEAEWEHQAEEARKAEAVAKEAKAAKAKAEEAEKIWAANKTMQDGILAHEAKKRRLAEEAAKSKVLALVKHWHELAKLGVLPDDLLMQAPKGPGPSHQ
jgi:membrane protein involved in colicin uptake